MMCMLSVTACLLMLVRPEITVSATKSAIRIWMNAVVPSLLPFMIIADYIKKSSIKGRRGGLLYPVLMAFFSGYPMGAKIAGESYRTGYLDEKDLYSLLCYAMITGPAFLIGGVGVTFYQSKTAGYVLALSHYAGALCCGRLLGKRGTIGEKPKVRQKNDNVSPSDTPFTDCILESFRTLGIVLAYIVLFMIAADFVQDTGVLRNLPEGMGAFCKGMLEMTVGCSEIAACGCSMIEKLMLSSFIISFGGLSVVGQTMSMLSGCPITLIQILKIKIIHGLFSTIWTFTIWTFVV